MAQVEGICTNCGEKLYIDSVKDADICPNCKQAFVTAKAISLYKSNKSEQALSPQKRKRHILRSLGKGLLMTLECVGYLLYTVSLMWLFFDIVDDIKKK